MEVNKIYNEPCLETIKKMPDNFLDCVITSPPYFQLRDYGYEGQWGLEPTYQEYLENLWSMMDELWRVLKPTGTVWINLGDSYNGTGNGHKIEEQRESYKKYNKNLKPSPNSKNDRSIPKKCLMLIPHRFAIGCIDRGWILRNDIIWAKPNGMPESTTDRFSKKHEYFFFFVKQHEYFFDLDAVRDKHKSIADLNRRVKNGVTEWKVDLAKDTYSVSGEGRQRTEFYNPKGKNPGDVSDFWDIHTKPSSNEHYASYNDELLKKPLLAGCPEFVCVKCGMPRLKINKPILMDNPDRELVEYDRSKPYAIQERSGLIETRDLPPLKEIKEYLKKWKGDWTIEKIEETMNSQAPHHWFSGESYPSHTDWIKIKELLGFDDTYDYQMTTIKYKPSEKGETEYVMELSNCGCGAEFNGGLVYDPFMGTGSTAEVCLRTKRNFIGSEMSKEYIDIANKRLDPFLKQPTLF